MKTAYSYIRWSTASQGESNKDSRKRQTDSAAKWIREYGNNQYVLSDETFIDAGKSGHKGEHIATDEYGKAKGELRRFIQLVEDGKIKNNSILLIDSVDRFSRLDPLKALGLFIEVINSGIGLMFTGSYNKSIINTELIKKEGHVLQFIVGEMIRSYNESAEKSRKIKSSIQSRKSKMKAGQIVSHNNVPQYFTFDKDQEKYLHNENTEIVKELIKGILDGKTLYSMADSLNERKVKTFRYGEYWSGNSISRILRNRVLVGEFLGVKDFLPPVLDENDFQRIQSILSKNTFNHGKVGLVVNIFRGIAKCSSCKCNMQVMTQWIVNKKPLKVPYRYLKCSRANSGSHMDCKNRNTIRLEPLEIDFFSNFRHANPYQVINAEDKSELKELNDDIATKQNRLVIVNKSIQDTMKLIGSIEMEELQVKLSDLNKERETLTTDINELKMKVSGIQDAPNILDGIKLTLLDFDAETETELTSTEFNEPAIVATLKSNKIREKLRILLPNVIGRIEVDTSKRLYKVFNCPGKLVYTSKPFPSLRNNSDVWRASLKTWSVKAKRTAVAEKMNAK